jgi:hypothetical protein
MMARVGPTPTFSIPQIGSADPEPFGVRDYERPSVVLRAIESADQEWAWPMSGAVIMR